jgi:hypothetical protein
MNSLNTRINNIENALSLHCDDNDIISLLKKREEQKQRDNIDRMNSTFKEYIHENINENIGLDRFVDVMVKSVKYSRENNLSISRTLSIKPSEDLEQETSIHFVKSIYGNTFDNDMLRGCVKSIMNILYPTIVENRLPSVDTITDDKPLDTSDKKSRKFKLFK